MTDVTQLFAVGATVLLGLTTLPYNGASRAFLVIVTLVFGLAFARVWRKQPLGRPSEPILVNRPQFFLVPALSVVLLVIGAVVTWLLEAHAG